MATKMSNYAPLSLKKTHTIHNSKIQYQMKKKTKQIFKARLIFVFLGSWTWILIQAKINKKKKPPLWDAIKWSIFILSLPVIFQKQKKKKIISYKYRFYWYFNSNAICWYLFTSILYLSCVLFILLLYRIVYIDLMAMYSMLYKKKIGHFYH